MLVCPYCASELYRKNGFDSFSGEQRYKCRKCGRGFKESSTGRAKPVTYAPNVIRCAQCGKETTNPKFCSSSCAAKYNNHHMPKRKQKTHHCKRCGVAIIAGRTVCDACNPSLVDWNKRTLKSLQVSAKYQVSAKVRDIARYNYEKANLPRICANCGYDKHVEICHIQAINSFPDETPVATINDLSNLVALCPNCHWELDHDLLKINN